MVGLVNNHLEWVSGSKFLGMVTLSNILLDVKIFGAKDETSQNRLLILLFHEMFHMIFRLQSHDFSWLTPRHKLDKIEEHLEGGYLFEKLLFGTIEWDISYLDKKCFFDLKRWNN
jgi:hypothetical protein